MKWSWRLGTIAGIPVYVHATFLLLIGWVALSHWQAGHTVAAVLSGVGFILVLFGCVVLHELGHALVARKYGIKTRDITLLPIGGVARLERMPDDPRQELWVALAGPAVNLVIAGALYAWLRATGGPGTLDGLGVASGSFVARVMVVNTFLALFNLLPAFPMDGGRVLRAVLATRLEYARATQIAATVGQAMALLFGFAGFFANPFLLFIAFFVWIGASQETGLVQMRSALSGVPVARAMITDFRTLSPGDRLGRAVELILTGWQHDFPVVADGRAVGVLARNDLLVALARRGVEAPVDDVMRRELDPLDSFDMLETALPKLHVPGASAVPVTHQGRLVGLLTLENVGEFIAVQSALRSVRAGVRPSPSEART